MSSDIFSLIFDWNKFTRSNELIYDSKIQIGDTLERVPSRVQLLRVLTCF